MRWNKKRLKKSKLYLILDRSVNTYPELFNIMKQSVAAGVDIVQLRDKQGSARDMLLFAQKAMKYLKGRAAFIMNDRVDLAKIAGVDGVHLGQEDICYADARALLGRQAVIGVSCQTLAMARRAEKEGADYLGFGSIFKTQTKPERDPMDLKKLQRVLRIIEIPVFPIGGININNVSRVTEVGAARVAVCRDIALAKNMKKQVEQYRHCLDR